MDQVLERYAPLEDITIRSDGTGRTVEAYAAVFGQQQEVRDFEGHYFEELGRSSFDRTTVQRAGKFQSFYNHGRTMQGTPAERFSMPLGRVEEVRAEDRGLLTVTRYSATPLADEVLEQINDGTITGMSWSGTAVQTERTRPKGSLPIFKRTEIALREFGPTPFPTYADAKIVAVRAEAGNLLALLEPEELAAHLRGLPDVARAVLLDALNAPAADTGTGDGPLDTEHAAVQNRKRQHRTVQRMLAKEAIR